jgi:F420-dependent oxidoreductase-like protein
VAIPRLGLTITASKQISFREVVELVRRAEGLGYDSVWVPETWGTDAVSVLAVLAAQTERIRLASGVFNVFSRSAALIAQTAATLQNLAQGRFLLGLGTSGPIVVEGWHGVPYKAPLQRTREYVEVVRIALAGERVDHDGELLNLRNFKLLNPPERRVPVYIAALGPRNVRLTGEIADGWLPIFAPLGRLGGLRRQLQEGAESAGRRAEDIDVAAYIPVLVGQQGDRFLRQQLAYYVGSMGTYYAEFVTQAGFGDEVRAIRERWQAGDRPGAVRAVGDDMLATCTLGSDPGEARRRIDVYRAGGVNLPILSFPHGSGSEAVADTIEALSGA